MNNCICIQDGPCPRYGCEMAGRLRQICRGENIDPALAEQYRQRWLTCAPGSRPADCPYLGEEVKEDGETKTKECASCGGRVRLKLFHCSHPALAPHETTHPDCGKCIYRPRTTQNARKLILHNDLSPGDIVVMTAAVRSLHEANPGKFLTAVQTTWQEIWEHNPDISPVQEGDLIDVRYPAINQCNQRGIHFMQAYCEFLEHTLQVRVPLLVNRPQIYLSAQEKAWISQIQELTGKPTRFALVNSGHKSDYTTKHWGFDSYQRVVDALRGKVLFVQVGSPEHNHRPLKNVIDLIGKTDARQLIRLIYHASFGLGGVSLLQHLCAGLEKPYFCLLGGREPASWNTYPKQQLYSTIGLLTCCRDGGCWRSRTVPLNDGQEQDKSLCENPVIGDEPVPRCMALISPSEIVQKILLLE